MTKKSKSTKEVRAIDSIIKFQLDDGIESLTISGKEALADVSIDSKANVTLYLNADKDKLNDIQSLVPFVTVKTTTGGTETDKTKTVTLSQDLTQFALEIADNSKELASLIKSKSSIKLDLGGLVQQLLEIAGKLAELEQKNQEQDQRLTAIEAKEREQDNKLATLETEQAEHASKLSELGQKNQEQDNHLTVIDAKDLEQDNRLTKLENMGGTSSNFEQKMVKTVNLFSRPISDMYIAESSNSTTNLSCVIGDERSIRNGIVFIGIYRFIDGELDGQTSITAMFNEYEVSNSSLPQDYIVEMKTFSSGNIKLHCELIQYRKVPEIKLYGIPKDAKEIYKISVKGFKFEDELVLAPLEDKIIY